ncbi:hypothetical protein Geob_3843 [Geotalea daltonii FRC-32]|uniref:Uncharacterized protein n=1 Tax=Geotalea daltonii (strain DSM 22248 / JCM 15807 / FRC-32) TaxID=316067 RepID=A0A068EZW0_GEODF|nr:hypothetical protein Geob_3843 [Geotalea daltonii FRC-32]
MRPADKLDIDTATDIRPGLTFWPVFSALLVFAVHSCPKLREFVKKRKSAYVSHLRGYLI